MTNHDLSHMINKTLSVWLFNLMKILIERLIFTATYDWVFNSAYLFF